MRARGIPRPRGSGHHDRRDDARQILPGIETDLSRELSGTLERLGVHLYVGTKAAALKRGDATLTMTVDAADGKKELTAEMLFVTVGKRPASRDLGLGEAGVNSDPKTGFIPVDDQMRTNQSHIYAVGDVAAPDAGAQVVPRGRRRRGGGDRGSNDPIPVPGDAERRLHGTRARHGRPLEGGGRCERAQRP